MILNLTKGFMKKQITYLMTALLATIAVSNAVPPDKATMEAKANAKIKQRFTRRDIQRYRIKNRVHLKK